MFHMEAWPSNVNDSYVSYFFGVFGMWSDRRMEWKGLACETRNNGAVS